MGRRRRTVTSPSSKRNQATWISRRRRSARARNLPRLHCLTMYLAAEHEGTMTAEQVTARLARFKSVP